MRILQIVQGFPAEFVAGTERYCHTLTQALHNNGHQCFVLAGSSQQLQEPALVTTEQEGMSISRYVSPLSSSWREQEVDSYNPEAEQLIRRQLELIRPDVVHIHHWIRLTNTLVSLTEGLGIPTVVTLHDLWTTCARIHRQHRLGHFCQQRPSPSLCASCVETPPWHHETYVQQTLALRQEQIENELQRARVIVVPSTSHQQLLSALLDLPADRLRILPHGSLVRLIPASSENNGTAKFPHRPLRLAYWGYLVHHKGVHLLLEAVRQLPTPSAVEVVLAGHTPDPHYLTELQTLAQGLSVSFLGPYQPPDLARLDVDLAVFPSLASESYGFVLDEAFQLGLPVLVSDRGAFATRAGAAGLAFAAGNAGALAHRIEEVLTTPSIIEEMRGQASSRVSPTMAEHVVALEALYQEARELSPRESVPISTHTTRRLTALYTRAATTDQEIVSLQHNLQQQRLALEQQAAARAQQEELLRQREAQHQQELAHQQQELTRQHALQQQELLHQQELARQHAQHYQEELQRTQEAQRQHVHRHQQEMDNLNKQLETELVKVRAFEDWFRRFSRGIGWRILSRIYYVREHLVAPPGTRRGKVYDLFKRTGVTYADGGMKKVLTKTRQRLDRATAVDPYQTWLVRHTLTPQQIRQLATVAQAFAYQPTISIVTPVYNTDEVWLRKAIESVQNQIYPHWQLCLCDDGSTASHVSRVLTEYAERDKRIRVLMHPQNGGISAASNGALTLATGEFVGLLDHDDELTPDALFEVVKRLNENPDLDFIYTDEDKLSPEGHRIEPFFKPDWSPDLLLSMNYITHFSVMRRSLVEEVGGFTEGLDGSQDHDLFFRLSEKTQKISHIAKPLYSWRKIPGSAASDTQAKPYAHVAGERALEQHLRRQGIAAEVLPGLVSPSHRRVRYQIIGQPVVSIIISIRDKVELLQRCIASIEEKTTYRHFEIVIVDNQSEKPETLAYLAQLPYTVVSAPGPFNYSRINNVGVSHTHGEFILFLNNDIEVIAEDWLSAMLEHAQRSEVGAVGAKLLYPDRTIQHAGVVLGVGGVAGHVFLRLPEDSTHYFGLFQVVRNCSAVTAACMMMRKSVFTEVGGFDERVKVAYNDVDLCLRIREKGYLIVYTPYALLYHFESSTRKNLHPLSDEGYVRQRWAKVLQEGDPYYNPQLTLERPDFSLRILDSDSSANAPH